MTLRSCSENCHSEVVNVLSQFPKLIIGENRISTKNIHKFGAKDINTSKQNLIQYLPSIGVKLNRKVKKCKSLV